MIIYRFMQALNKKISLCAPTTFHARVSATGDFHKYIIDTLGIAPSSALAIKANKSFDKALRRQSLSQATVGRRLIIGLGHRGLLLSCDFEDRLKGVLLPTSTNTNLRTESTSKVRLKGSQNEKKKFVS